jgi:uncharacterized membrane protein
LSVTLAVTLAKECDTNSFGNNCKGSVCTGVAKAGENECYGTLTCQNHFCEETIVPVQPIPGPNPKPEP